jgi:hypothetical protein
MQPAQAIPSLSEAIQLLEKVEATQMELMRRQEQQLSTEMEQDQDTKIEDYGEESDGNNVGGGEATEIYVVVPSVVLDTLLSLISLISDLYQLSPTSSELLDKLQSASTRAIDLANRVPERKDEVLATIANATIARFSASPLSSSDPDVFTVEALNELQRQASLPASRTPERLSDLADALLTVPFSVDRAQEALKLYDSARVAISLPLSRPSGLPSHQIPSLLAANLSSQSYAWLLLEEPSKAIEIAVEAIASCGAGWAIRIEPNSQVINLSVDRVSRRSDWMTIKALHESLFAFFRARFVLLGDLDAASSSAAALAGLAREAGCSGEEVQRWLDEEVRDDTFWRKTGGVEEASWMNLINAL